MDVIVRLRHPRSGDGQGQETFLAPPSDKPSRNYDIECSNHHPLLSTLRLKWLSRSKMKWWAIDKNLPVDVIVRLPHPQIGDNQNQETFLARSAEKPTSNYDIECSNHHPSLLTLSPKGLSHSKTKWWPIDTNLPVDVTVRLPHLWSGDSQGQKTFLAPSADKQFRNYDIECSNHHPSLSTLRPKWLSRCKMKWFNLAIKSVCLIVICTNNHSSNAPMLSATELLGHEFNLHSEPNLYNYANFIFSIVFKFRFVYCHDQYSCFYNRSFLQVMT